MITNGINQEEADKNSTGIANTIRNNKRLILGDNNNCDRKASFQQMEDVSRQGTENSTTMTSKKAMTLFALQEENLRGEAKNGRKNNNKEASIIQGVGNRQRDQRKRTPVDFSTDANPTSKKLSHEVQESTQNAGTGNGTPNRLHGHVCVWHQLPRVTRQQGGSVRGPVRPMGHQEFHRSSAKIGFAQPPGENCTEARQNATGCVTTTV